MRDLKYIIKRVLIGVGIVLVLGFINNAKASALEMYNGQEAPTFPDSCNGKKSILLAGSSFANLQPPNFNININQPNTTIFELYCVNTDLTDLIFPNSRAYDFTYYIKSFSGNSYYYYKNNNWISHSPSFLSGILNGPSYDYDLMNADTCPFKDSLGCLILYNSNANYWITNGTLMYTDFDLVKDSTHNYTYFDSATAPMLKPTIESLQPTKIINNNIITGYSFKPKFSNFDTSQYDFQYKFGKDSTTWLGLSSNEQQLKFNANGVFYVRIKDKSSGNIIDSSTFTIISLGNFNTNVDYNINFTGEYRTKNYLNDNVSSKSSSTIEEYQIYIDYIPKNSILKYQYQYVNDGDSLDNNNWQTLASSNNGTFTYVATQNGTLYARILDSSDNILYSSTFTVNSIGLLAYDNNSKPVDNFFTKISNQLGFGGPIGSLINIPISLVSTILGAMTGNFNTCTNYNLGSLWGTNLYIPCVNVKQHLGNSFYNTIDLICSCCMFYMLVKMLLLAYDKFINMEHDPLGDSTILYGDRRF